MLSLVGFEQAALWLVDVEQLWMELDTFRVRGVPSTHHLTTDVQRQHACYTFVHVAGCTWSHILHVVVILNVTLQINSSWSEQYYPDCKTLGLWMSFVIEPPLQCRSINSGWFEALFQALVGYSTSTLILLMSHSLYFVTFLRKVSISQFLSHW